MFVWRQRESQCAQRAEAAASQTLPHVCPVTTVKQGLEDWHLGLVAVSVSGPHRCLLMKA